MSLKSIFCCHDFPSTSPGFPYHKILPDTGADYQDIAPVSWAHTNFDRSFSLLYSLSILLISLLRILKTTIFKYLFFISMTPSSPPLSHSRNCLPSY